MTKRKGKSNSRKSYYIKDKAIVNFILAHSKKPKIDFSKIKIHPFFNILHNEEENKKYKDAPKLFDANELYIRGKEKKMLEPIPFPTFHFSSLNNINFELIKDGNPSKIKSLLFY